MPFRGRGRVGSGRSLPPGVVPMMDSFGRFEFDPSGGGVDASSVWENVLQPMLTLAQPDRAGFLRELAAAVVPVGGWAAYGGAHLVMELFGGDLDDPSYHAMMAESLDFLRSNGVPTMRLNGYESAFWGRTRGHTEPWFARASALEPGSVRLTPIGVGEHRFLAQLERRDDSNLIYARRDPQGRWVALVDARQSDEDPTRTSWELRTAATQYDLYLEIGALLQVPPFRYEPELAPFFLGPEPSVAWLPGGGG